MGVIIDTGGPKYPIPMGVIIEGVLNILHRWGYYIYRGPKYLIQMGVILDTGCPKHNRQAGVIIDTWCPK